MAFPTAVNSQITDSVGATNTKTLGDAPAISLANLYQATAQALAIAAHNATNSQQQFYVTAQAAATLAIAKLLNDDPLLVPASPKPTPTESAPSAGATDLAAQVSEALISLNSGSALDSKPEGDSLQKKGATPAESWAKAAKQILEAVADGLTLLQRVNAQGHREPLKQAALAMALRQMIAFPERQAEYQKVIDSIQRL